MACEPDVPAERRQYQARATVTYAAHNVFSVSIHASYDCGGAYPTNDADLSTTFDLLTGRSVSFRELWQDSKRDVARIASIYRATLSAEDITGCEQELSADTLAEYGFTYSLSKRGLAVQPSFPHVIEACAVPSILSFDSVRGLAAQGSVLARVAAAERP
jgi:hypothetical protein